MSRVIAGTARGRMLKTPEGMETRPTTDRCKEALFGMIQFDVAGTSFLDLFAGSGQIGIEALSRGALSCDFVEQGPKALSCIRENLQLLKMQSQAAVWPLSAERALDRFSAERRTFDIIFMDPPYQQGWEEKIGKLVAEKSLLSANGFLIIESSSQTEVAIPELECFKVKTYKTTRFSFFSER